MKLPIKTAGLGLIMALLFASATALGAQSLLDNQYYNLAKDLLSASRDALNVGDYDTAARMARQAKEALESSDALVLEMMQFYRANGWLSQAKDRVAYAKSIRADVNYKTSYETAVAAITDAAAALDVKQYDDSIASSKAALTALQDIAPAAAAAVEPGPPPLPQYYTVRLVLPLRDCFWRIAAYPFVYNDPWKWRLLYQANKDVIEDSNNPDLIEVGMRFVIPPLAGETREGDYDPSMEYPSVSP